MPTAIPVQEILYPSLMLIGVLLAGIVAVIIINRRK